VCSIFQSPADGRGSGSGGHPGEMGDALESKIPNCPPGTSDLGGHPHPDGYRPHLAEP
jgi:hypothetical protein